MGGRRVESAKLEVREEIKKEILPLIFLCVGLFSMMVLSAYRPRLCFFVHTRMGKVEKRLREKIMGCDFVIERLDQTGYNKAVKYPREVGPSSRPIQRKM